MRSVIVHLLLVFALTLSVKAADGEDGCEKFAWPLAREQVWFASSGNPRIAVGEHPAMVPGGAFGVRLKPATQAVFATPPERKAKSEASFGGSIWFPVLGQGGIYQVTLSEDVWIDIVQDGRFARSVGHAGRKDCPGLRKPVSFVLQFSDAPYDTIHDKRVVPLR